MKLSHIFTLVVLLHFCVVGTLFVFPGCSSFEDIRPVGDRLDEPSGGPAHTQATATPQAEVSPDYAPQRVPPTRPSWNVSSSPEPEIIEGFDSIEVSDAGFNAINPDLVSDGEVVVVTAEDSGLSVAPVTTTYTVVKGDNLTRIARANGVSLGELMEANDMNKNSILQVGQVLVIPTPLEGPQAPAAPVVSSVDGSIEGEAYTVKKGDTLGGIARRFGTSVGAIRAANDMSGNVIYADQTLVVPAGSGGPVAPSVAAKPAPVETGPGETPYVVKAGDTLGGIARRYNVTTKELADRNGISDPRKLRAGATLVIPGQGGSAPTPAPATGVGPVPAPKPEISPAPAPAQPVIIEEDVVVEEFDFDDLDDIPVVPVETSD